MSLAGAPYAKLESLEQNTLHQEPLTLQQEVSGKIGSAAPLATSNNATPSQSMLPSNTLDEPVQETIMRDLRNIWNKILQVLDPRLNNKQNVLRDWDWWGPLLLCLALSLRLSLAGDSGGNMFATTFVVIWFGSAVVTINSQLLGGKISFFQSVCVLGYCIFPLVSIAYICIAVPSSFIKLILVALAYIWSTYASMNFLAEVNLEKKKLLAVYPIFLFYFTIAWLVFLSIS